MTFARLCPVAGACLSPRHFFLHHRRPRRGGHRALRRPCRRGLHRRHLHRPDRSAAQRRLRARAVRHPHGHRPRRRRAHRRPRPRAVGRAAPATSAGNIASVDRDTGKATAKFSAAPVTAAVDPNAALTFAVAPYGDPDHHRRARRDHQSGQRGRDGRLGPRASPPATRTPASRPLRPSTTRPTGG